jgi:DNA-binding SARP family transcriptional activator
MRTASRGVPGGIPDFGMVVPRPRLVNLLQSGPPGLAVVAAPSGYGKSVLAAQYALGQGRSSAWWVDFGRCQVDEIACLRRILGVLAPEESSTSDGASSRLVTIRDETADLIEAVAHALFLRGQAGSKSLVLDDLPAISAAGSEILVELAERLGQMGVRTIATVRAVPDGILPRLHSAQIVDSQDLRLSLGEAVDIARQLSGRPLTTEDVAPVLEASGGHPAVYSVLIRHAVSNAGEPALGRGPSLDLQSRLLHLAESALEDSEREALSVMAMLGSGDTRDLTVCGAPLGGHAMQQVETAIPLVRVGLDREAAHVFRMHELAQEVFRSHVFRSTLGGFVQDAWPKAVEVLNARGDLLRAATTVERMGTVENLVEWLLAHGKDLLLAGGAISMARMMRSIPTSAYVQLPNLLLLQAQVHQEKSELADAIEKATVARTIAEHEHDEPLSAAALLLCGQCFVDMGNYSSAFAVLTELASGPHRTLHQDDRAWTFAALGACGIYMGLGDEAIAFAEAARESASRKGTSESIRVFVSAGAGAVSALARGDFAGALVHFAHSCEATSVPRAQLAKAQGNLGVSLCEMGRLERAVEAIQVSLTTCLESDRRVNRGAFLPVRGAAVAAMGASESGIRLMREGISLSLDAGDRYGASYNRIYLATTLRAVGHAEESLSEAEQALEFFSGLEASSQRELATLEIAASLLSLDDVNAALRAAEAVRSQMSGLNAYHLLRADMVLAEGERRLGRTQQAAARLANHEWHVLSESSNWQIAMYCRAYPDLLGLFAVAIDPERLPSHMLRMILPENAERILPRTRDLLGDDLWRRLGVRLLGEEGFKEYVERDGRPLCRVRLFGGLEVNVGGRIVAEREWRKRKARLLFAMLVIRRGQDVPRDQLFEHLWPEMDEARAKNNLYVIWSAMKNALTPDSDKNTPCPYIENVGGVCRVAAESVRSDVDEFERTLSEARSAQAAGDVPDALRSYERLAEVYRGELLPGDVYDDWFSQIREEFRTLYTDAMLEAASLLMDGDDPVGALTFARRALSHDPWREDLYQAALRSQIAAGQRSAAIETYLQCRSRLSEDLGLDPSAETRALYDQILTMEERPRPGRPYFDDPLFNA